MPVNTLATSTIAVSLLNHRVAASFKDNLVEFSRFQDRCKQICCYGKILKSLPKVYCFMAHCSLYVFLPTNTACRRWMPRVPKVVGRYFIRINRKGKKKKKLQQIIQQPELESGCSGDWNPLIHGIAKPPSSNISERDVT
ncbi:hypothetical protein CEXT_260771 [Caerostris extrusa]|uniref:Uncharacterized protein n=1 Tax=Caerostris extrusa TaxID=172846 RepID=A0AAV4Y377_CAEEX|nr:hypothetical protein CEXT_260771 [Caerostris extrusa]